MKAGRRAWLLMAFAMGFGSGSGCRRAPEAASDDHSEIPPARPEALVSPEWVRAAMAHRDGGYRGERPEGWRHDRLVVVEAAWVRPGEKAAYDHGHVPGAVLINTEDLENGFPRWQLRPVGELQAVIGRAGISPESTVVVYGRSMIAAARVWWIFGYAGVDDVRLMNGGYDGWRNAGYDLDSLPPSVQPVPFAATPRSHWLATTEEVRKRIAAGDVWLGDVRSTREFAAKTSGYRYLDARGRLPGALHLGDADDHAGLYAGSDGQLTPPGEILALWQRQGLAWTGNSPRFHKEVIFYCGGGWRSSLAFFHAWRLGLDNVRNYSDGWAGWSTQYLAEPTSGGSTPGWRQTPTGNPVEAP